MSGVGPSTPGDVHVDRLRLVVDDPVSRDVSAALHRPAIVTGPPVLLAHSAGSDLDDEPLVALAQVIASVGHPAVRVNLPFREVQRRGAPRAEHSVEPYAAVLRAAAAHLGVAGPWVVGGRSYGGRVASLLVAAQRAASQPPSPDPRWRLPAMIGLLCASYPLHPPHRPDRLRVEHWPRLAIPTLLLQGTRDPLCRLALLDDHVPSLAGPVTVRLVAGGDHTLRTTASFDATGVARPPASTIADLTGDVSDWLASLPGEHAPAG